MISFTPYVSQSTRTESALHKLEKRAATLVRDAVYANYNSTRRDVPDECGCEHKEEFDDMALTV